MISKREKLQYVCTFVTDILSLALSIALGWLVVQDLVVVLALALLPALTGAREAGGLAEALGGTLLQLIAFLAAGSDYYGRS